MDDFSVRLTDPHGAELPSIVHEGTRWYIAEQGDEVRAMCVLSVLSTRGARLLRACPPPHTHTAPLVVFVQFLVKVDVINNSLQDCRLTLAIDGQDPGYSLISAGSAHTLSHTFTGWLHDAGAQ